MTVEEQIKEVANKYAKTQTILSAGLILTARNSFVDGANFGREIGVKEAFEWINTYEEPEGGVPLLLKINHGGYSEYRVGWYLDHPYRGYGFYTYPEPDIEFLTTDVAAYRYIRLEDMP